MGSKKSEDQSLEGIMTLTNDPLALQNIYRNKRLVKDKGTSGN